jgi:hypothetical protein
LFLWKLSPWFSFLFTFPSLDSVDLVSNFTSVERVRDLIFSSGSQLSCSRFLSRALAPFPASRIQSPNQGFVFIVRFSLSARPVLATPTDSRPARVFAGLILFEVGVRSQLVLSHLVGVAAGCARSWVLGCAP